jgi:hypothetical protein
VSLPTFFIIGAMKAGTTSLHEYLSHHPEIHMSRVKEPHFFTRPEDGPYRERVGTLPDYEALFTSSCHVRGESSPGYSHYPHHQGVPERIKAMLPDAKFIYLVRDPVDRIVSHYLHNVAFYGVRADLAEHVGDVSDPANPYLYISLYAMQLEQYLPHFPLDSFLVIDQSELASNREVCLERALDFLGVASDVELTGLDREHGASADRRRWPSWYPTLTRRIVSSPIRRLPKPLRRTGLRLVEQTFWRPLERPDVSERFRKQVQRAVWDDIDRLRGYTGLDFPSWRTLR